LKGKVDERRLPGIRNYLYQSLLKSLESYNYQSNVAATLRSLTMQIEILWTKGLYDLSEKLLVRGIELATRYESFSSLIELERMHLRQAHIHISSKKGMDIIRYAFNNWLAAADKYKNITDYARLESELSALMDRDGYFGNKGDMEKYDEFFSQPLLCSENAALSQHARLNYYYFHSFYALIRNDFALFNARTETCIRIMREMPRPLAKYDQFFYGILLNNYVLSFIYLKRFVQAHKWIGEMKKMNPMSTLEKNYLITTIFNQELTVLNKTGNFDKAVRLIAKDEGSSLSILTDIDKGFRANLLLSFAYAYFGTGNYKEAGQNLNQIIEEGTRTYTYRKDIYFIARLMKIIILYETEDTEGMINFSRATSKFFKEQKFLFRFDKILIPFFEKKIWKYSKEDERVRAFRLLKSGAEAILEDPFERKNLFYFDFLIWIKSKTEGISFGSMIKKSVLGN
jgi:hypothetical protein